MSGNVRDQIAQATVRGGCKRSRLARGIGRALRDMAVVVLSASAAIDANADEELPALPPLPIPYLDLQRKEQVRTSGGRYFATDKNPMHSAIRMSGPRVFLDIADADLYAYYRGANGMYVRNGAKAIARGLRTTTTEEWAHGYATEGATFHLESSVVKTRAANAYGLLARQNTAVMRFAGGTVTTLGAGAYGALVSDRAVLELDEALKRDGMAPDPVRIETHADDTAGIFAYDGATLNARAASVQTYGMGAPAIIVDHATANLSKVSLGTVARHIPFVVARNAATLTLADMVIDQGDRLGPAIEIDASSVLELRGAATARGLTAIRITRNDALPAGGRIVVSDRARIEGGIDIDPVEPVRLEVHDEGEFRGDLNGRASLDVGVRSRVVFEGSTRLASLSNAGVVGFAPDGAGRRALVVEGSLSGSDGASLRLCTELDIGGVLRAQQTDRVLVAGDVSGVHRLDIVPSGLGGQTDTNADGEIQANEGISLVQVTGNATPQSFALPGGVLAVGAYQYELTAFAPGKSDPSQRLAPGGEAFWDFRLATRKKPDPVVDTPRIDTPSFDIPSADTPSGDIPSVETPSIDMPSVDAPIGDIPNIDTPEADKPAANVPASEMPNADVTVPERPAESTPASAEGSATAHPDQPSAPSETPDASASTDAATDSGSQADPGPGHDTTPSNADAAPAEDTSLAHAHASTPSVDGAASALILQPRPESVHGVSYVVLPEAAADLLRTALLAWGPPAAFPDAVDTIEAPYRPKGFASIFGARERVRGTTERTEHEYRFRSAQHGVQAGLPIYELRHGSASTRVDVGFGMSEATVDTDVPGAPDRSRVRAAGMGFALLHRHASGPYALYERGLIKLDAVSIDVRSGQRELTSTGGSALSMLGEIGLSMALPYGVDLSPSISASYIDVRIADAVDPDDYAIHLQGHRATAVRFAARAVRPFSVERTTLVPYIQTGVTFSGGPPMSHRVGDSTYATTPAGSAWNLALGLSARIGKHAAIHIDLETDRAFGRGVNSTRADGSLQWSF